MVSNTFVLIALGAVAAEAATTLSFLNGLAPETVSKTPSFSAHTSKHADEITNIPGYGKPDTRMYSGYVSANGHNDESNYNEERKDYLHYWLVESEGSPETDPLVIWLNGGPGASSLMGFFTEFGPLVLDNQDGVMRNPYNWNKRGNLLFFESPSGVGYSFCESEKGTKETCSNGDTSTAAQNLEALRQVVERFPEYKGRDLIITGESYAGVYIPTFALNIVKDKTLDLNLISLLVGNPCTDDATQNNYFGWNLRYAFENGLLDENLYHTLTVKCGMLPNDSRSKIVSKQPECVSAYRQFLLASSDNTGTEAKLPGTGFVDGYATFGAKNQPYWDEAARWLNRDDVQEALHVKSMAIQWGLFATRLNYTKEYNACNNGPSDSHRYSISMVEVYQQLVGKIRNIVLFNGDSDPSVQMHGTANAVRSFGFPEVKDCGWRPWFYKTTATAESVMKQKSPYWGIDLSRTENGVQMGGYVTNYEKGLSFVTFHGAVGHMVPQYKTVAALHFLHKTMDNAILSPPLPSEDEMAVSDNDFFGDGVMAKWVAKAQTDEFLK